MSEKIKLQVGDHAFTTSRETLCMRKGSMLEAMFSGRHSIKPEEDGSIFIDRDGEHFKLILNYLRDGKLPSGLSNDTREALAAEAEYYQLEDLVERLTPTAQKIVEYKTVAVNFNGSWHSWREKTTNWRCVCVCVAIQRQVFQEVDRRHVLPRQRAPRETAL